VLAVRVLQGHARGCNVFGHPGWVARSAVVGARQGEGGDGIGDGAGEAILKDSCWVDGRCNSCCGCYCLSGEGGRGGLGWRCGGYGCRGRSDGSRDGSGFLLLGGWSGVEEGCETCAGGGTGGRDGRDRGLGHDACCWFRGG
jgi:hypothetical protein